MGQVRGAVAASGVCHVRFVSGGDIDLGNGDGLMVSRVLGAVSTGVDGGSAFDGEVLVRVEHHHQVAVEPLAGEALVLDVDPDTLGARRMGTAAAADPLAHFQTTPRGEFQRQRALIADRRARRPHHWEQLS